LAISLVACTPYSSNLTLVRVGNEWVRDRLGTA